MCINVSIFEIYGGTIALLYATFYYLFSAKRLYGQDFITFTKKNPLDNPLGIQRLTFSEDRLEIETVFIYALGFFTY